MPTIALVGTDSALLEGLAQTLGAAGHRIVLAHSIGELDDRTLGDPPLLLVMERSLLTGDRLVPRLPLAAGGAVVLYRGGGDTPAPLRPALQRLAIAELVLPLERTRLLALVQSVDERAQRAGRTSGGVRTPEPAGLDRI